MIFTSLVRLNGDNHPDAHACRLKIALVTFDSPVICPFDLTVQMSRYIIKLGHVSAVCRIPVHEEFELLQQCVCEESDPRYIDPRTGKPRYTLYEITLVKNRRFYIEALLNKETIAQTFVVPRLRGEL
jgi:hypothetical protein